MRMFHGMTEVTDSPIFCDETEKAYLCENCCKQQFSKEALFR